MATELSQRVACRVTLLTPPGRGAVATIAVEGRDSAQLIASRFTSSTRRPTHPLPVGRIFHGRWRNDRGTAEEIVLCRRAECSFEVNCHGGSAASEAIIGSLVADGAMRPLPADWLAERVADPLRRAAWLALCHARTPRTAGILLDQFRGALTHAVTEIVESLRADPADSADVASGRLARLLDLSPAGLHLTTPWHVVIAGPPNVGKSSLLNAILGYQRAIVLDQPGTTRDVLSAATALAGWLVDLFDTAGLREDSPDTIEAEGISRARVRIETADLVVWVEDGTASPLDSASWPRPTQALLEVVNKCDLPQKADRPRGALATSAVTGEGIERLAQTIVDRLVSVAPEPGEAVPFTAQQVAALERMRDAMAAGDAARAAQCGESLLADVE
jgi:tRNA modification GTPase